MHHGSRKGVATLRTVRSIINNMIVGVTKGYKYKMRYVYAHFPINVNLDKEAETGRHTVEIRNFLGEKIVRNVTMQDGVTVEASKNVKDQLELTGEDLEKVSQSAADIQQVCRVKNKDIRKVSFLFLLGLRQGGWLNADSSWTDCMFRRGGTSSTRHERDEIDGRCMLERCLRDRSAYSIQGRKGSIMDLTRCVIGLSSRIHDL